MDEPRDRQVEPLASLVGHRLAGIAADGEYLRAIERLYTHPSEHGVLSPTERALILLATEVLVTQLDADSLRRAMTAALEAGATDAEIRATIQLSSVIGLHSISFGVPRLVRLLISRGQWPPAHGDRDRVQRVVTKGYRGKPVQGMLRDIAELDPEYFEKFRDALEIPWSSGSLSPVMMQLICIAIDGCSSHLYEEGLELHLREALDAGASPEQILEVFQLCSVVGLRSIAAAFPMLRGDG